MTDDRLPIVYKGRIGSTLFVLAIGAAFLIVGFFAAQEPMSHMVGGGRTMRLPAPVVGWMLMSGGVVLLGFMLAGIMRGCPRLELGAEGIAFTSCWTGTRRMAWRDLERVDIRRNARADMESVALIPVRGRAIFVGDAVAPSKELRATIERIAAQRKAKG